MTPDSPGVHLQQVHRSWCKAGDWPERAQAEAQLQQLEALLQVGRRRALRCGLRCGFAACGTPLRWRRSGVAIRLASRIARPSHHSRAPPARGPHRPSVLRGPPSVPALTAPLSRPALTAPLSCPLLMASRSSVSVPARPARTLKGPGRDLPRAQARGSH